MAADPRLVGRVAIVTGAASGIGRGIAEKFASHGAKVVVADLNAEGAQAVAATLPDAFGVGVDVTDEKAVQTVIDRTLQRYGRIDVLVSNAGFQYIAPVESFPFDVWKRMLDVHINGAFLFTKAVLKAMHSRQQGLTPEEKHMPQNGGSIIIMGSVHSKEASVLKSAYITAKHGLLGFTRAVAKEEGANGISCNLICPGYTLTPLVSKQIPEQAQKLGISEDEVVKNVMLKTTVDGVFSTIDDVAETALFLASHPTNVFTGQSLNISHGWRMD